ncbi:tyrosine-protein kinase STYK1 [Eucyclogobius newberryi]|uniref:tyrosine-protein kinase STYK1 n=1 Tax=Eucyclogobius newberryi TaxID=166745 RepID=UPI003B5952FB
MTCFGRTEVAQLNICRSMSSNTTEACAPDDKLCIVLEHQLGVIVVPAILLFLFVFILLFMIVLKVCSKEKSPPSAVANKYGHYQINQPSDHHRGDQNRHHHHRDNHHRDNRQTEQRLNNQRSQAQERHSSPRRSNRNRSHLQGIDAPAGINPLEHEELPMTVQQSLLTNAKPSLPAVPRTATERQHGAFGQATPLPETLLVKPDDSVSQSRAQMDRAHVVLHTLRDSASEAEKRRFVGLASFLSRLGPHPFIPALLGVVTARPPLMMVVEELRHRDLLGFLWRCRQARENADPGCDMTEKRIYTMAQQVASALDYLHTQQCVHGNVAARSVLVGGDLTVKLWGFSSAYRRSQGAAAATGGGTTELRKWQAPEVLARNAVTKNSDVWSFGILLYEMVTLGDAPFPQLSTTELLPYLQRQKFMRKPANCSNALFSLVKSCCQWSPEQRVSVPELIRKLESGERTANGSAALRVPEPHDVGKYLREAGYGEAYNYAVL